MLIILTIQLLITFCCIAAGFLFYSFIDNKPRSYIFYAITGLIIITILSQAISLFLPVNGFLFPALVVILLAYGALSGKMKDLFSALTRRIRELPLIIKIAGITLWLMLAFITAGPTMMDDTETYHIQMVKWINEFGTVPGLVNLHERFGFNSSWFSTIAFFNAGGVMDMYTIMNGLLSVWLCFYLIDLIQNQHNTGNNISIAAIVLLIFGLAFWPFIRGNAATANYDHITAVLVLILFIETFRSGKNDEFSYSTEWILWPLFLCSVRIINFPLVLLCIYAIIRLGRKKEYKVILYSLIAGILLMVPFLWRNVMVSGYPLYPSFAFNLFDVDWKADRQMMDRLLDYIKYYNRVSTAYMDLDQTRALGTTGWIPDWFRYLFMYDKIIVVTGLSGIAAMVLSLIRNRRRSQPLVLLMTAMVVFIIVWFVVAPDPRFIYGILFAGTFALFYHVASLLKISFSTRIRNTVFILLSASVLTYTVYKLITDDDLKNWIIPRELPAPAITEIERGGIIFHIPERVKDNWNARCYDTKLPCLYKIDPALEPRGRSAADGFRLKK